MSGANDCQISQIDILWMLPQGGAESISLLTTQIQRQEEESKLKTRTLL